MIYRLSDAVFNDTSIETIDLSMFEGSRYNPTQFFYRGAFEDCTSLKEVKLPKTFTTEIPERMFYNCTSLTSFDLTGFVTIGASAFSGTGFTSIKIPHSTVRTVGGGAFSNCQNLVSVDLSESAPTDQTTIYDGTVFANCPNLESITFPTDLNVRPKYPGYYYAVFYECPALKDITVPFAWASSFRHCKNIETVTVTNIAEHYSVNSDFEINNESNVFDETFSLKEITLLGLTEDFNADVMSPIYDYGTYIGSYYPGELKEDIENYIAESNAVTVKYDKNCPFIENLIAKNEENKTKNDSYINKSDYWTYNFYRPLNFVQIDASASTASVEKAPVARAEQPKAKIADVAPRAEDSNLITYGEVEVGATISYTITVTGNYEDEKNERYTMGLTKVSDFIPEGLTLDSSSVKISKKAVMASDHDVQVSGTLVLQDGKEYTYDEGTGELVVYYANLASNALVTVSFDCTVDDIGDKERVDFYNSATITETNVTEVSNTTYHYVGQREENRYDILLKYAGNVPNGFENSQNTYSAGETVTVPAPDTAEGYKISDWTFYDPESGEVLDVSAFSSTGSRKATADTTFNMPPQNIVGVAVCDTLTYNATQATVTYKFDGNEPDDVDPPSAELCNINSEFTVAAAPTTNVAGYRFTGWTINGLPAGDTITVTGDTVIVGNWERTQYTVTYVVNGTVGPDGNPNCALPATNPQSYTVGDTVTLAAVADQDDFVFDGWHSNDTEILGSTFTMPENDVTLYGAWTKITVQPCDIEYYANGALVRKDTVDNIAADYTLYSFETGLPQKDGGYLFAGWYTKDGEDGSAFDKIFKPANYVEEGKVKLYAHWVEEGTFDKNAEGDSNQYASDLTGFALMGVQIRSTDVIDDLHNNFKLSFDGLRFVTVYSNKMITELEGLWSSTTDVKYGYALAAKFAEDEAWMTAVGGDAGTKDFKVGVHDRIKSVECTKTGDANHKFFGDENTGYRLSTVVIKYEDNKNNETSQNHKDKDVYARSYVQYTDANGFGRTAYDTYVSQNDYDYFGACFTSLNKAIEAFAPMINQ